MATIPTGTAVINQAATLITYTNNTGVYNGTTNPGGYGTPNRSNDNDITDFIITKPDGTVVTIRNNKALTEPTQAAVPVVVPSAALTKTFTPVDLGYDTSYLTFPDGIYKLDCWTWYRVVGEAATVGEVVSSGKVVTISDGTFEALTTGFADTRWIKIINTEADERDRYIETILSNTEISLSQALDAEKFPDSTEVSIYAGYLTTVYLKVINGLLTCIQPKMAKYSLSAKSCCKQCGSPSIDKAMEIFFGIFSVDAQFKVGLYSEANKNIAALNKMCASEDCKC
jgi:hypothetical protein